ncbi:hypothetical protein [Glycomyces arizonensis]|uniref:hypothetical protein n=1 Tax=Glycomyces arizonensis TaxID=256035 RepID=UPI00040DFD61|nr:hypothetical protein [Glycomyces arizonensis]
MSYSQPPHYSFGDPGDSQPPQQPMSGGPAYSPQPTYQQQPMGLPTMAGPPLPPVQQKPSPVVHALGIGAALCFVGVVLFGILWFQAHGKAGDAEALADDRAASVDELQGQLDDAQAQLEDLQGQVDELEGQAADTEAMQACLDDLETYYDTPVDSQEEQDALDAFYVSCDAWIS